MTGLIRTRNGTFVFRSDIAADQAIFAWDIYCPDIGWRVPTHKWNKLPKGEIILFDIDDPPATVTYMPIIG